MRVAAIDIGSNAVRLALGEFQTSGELLVFDSEREPVRLGTDVFHGGRIGASIARSCIRAISRFEHVARTSSVLKIRTVATSAVREAKNSAEFCAQVEEETGLTVEVLSGLEEARLITLAVQRKLDLSQECALLLDIGGGSVEFTLVDGGKVIFSKSERLGAVRMLEGDLTNAEIEERIAEGVGAVFSDIGKELEKRNCSKLVGTGGNIECLGEIKVQLFNRKGKKEVTAEEHAGILKTLLKSNPKERERTFHLRSDRADVILPAAMVVQEVFKHTKRDRMFIPRVGLKEGVLWDMRPT